MTRLQRPTSALPPPEAASPAPMFFRWSAVVALIALFAALAVWSVSVQLSRARVVSGLVDAPAGTPAMVPQRDAEVLESLTQVGRFDAEQVKLVHENAPFGRVPLRDTGWLPAVQRLAKVAGASGALWLQSAMALSGVLLGCLYLAFTRGMSSTLFWAAGAFLLYPLNTYLWLPGISRSSLALVLAGTGVLLAITELSGGRHRRWALVLGGVLCGAALETELSLAFPFVAAVALGLLSSLWLPFPSWGTDEQRNKTAAYSGLWLGVTVSVAACIEFAQRHPTLSGLLDSNRVWPYFAALLGLLGMIWSRDGSRFGTKAVRFVPGVLLLITLPLAFRMTEGWGPFSGGLGWSAIARGGSSVEMSLSSWLFSGERLLELSGGLAAVAGIVAFSLTAKETGRGPKLLVLVFALVAFGAFLAIRPGAWAALELLALVLTVPLVGDRGLFHGRALVLLPSWAAGVVCVVVANRGASPVVPTAAESESLVERHLALWLEPRVGTEETVLAPPRLASGLAYFGKLNVVGTENLENREGFATLLTIAAGPTMEQIQGTVSARRIRYLVMPDWDLFMKTCGQRYLGASRGASLLADEFEAWHLPNWVRPVPYQLPLGGSYEGRHLRLFEVVPEQSPATAAARLAEYFIETGESRLASRGFENLKKFPGDPGALAARALVAESLEDAAEFRRSAEALAAKLAVWGERPMPLDRRVSVATVLAKSDQNKLATLQVTRCLRDLNLENLSSLTTGGTYMLLVLSENYGLKFSDLGVKEAALARLPSSLRAQLQKP